MARRSALVAVTLMSMALTASAVNTKIRMSAAHKAATRMHTSAFLSLKSLMTRHGMGNSSVIQNAGEYGKLAKHHDGVSEINKLLDEVDRRIDDNLEQARSKARTDQNTLDSERDMELAQAQKLWAEAQKVHKDGSEAASEAKKTALAVCDKTMADDSKLLSEGLAALDKELDMAKTVCSGAHTNTSDAITNNVKRLSFISSEKDEATLGSKKVFDEADAIAKKHEEADAASKAESGSDAMATKIAAATKVHTECNEKADSVHKGEQDIADSRMKGELQTLNEELELLNQIRELLKGVTVAHKTGAFLEIAEKANALARRNKMEPIPADSYGAQIESLLDEVESKIKNKIKQEENIHENTSNDIANTRNASKTTCRKAFEQATSQIREEGKRIEDEATAARKEANRLFKLYTEDKEKSDAAKNEMADASKEAPGLLKQSTAVFNSCVDAATEIHRVAAHELAGRSEQVEQGHSAEHAEKTRKSEIQAAFDGCTSIANTNYALKTSQLNQARDQAEGTYDASVQESQNMHKLETQLLTQQLSETERFLSNEKDMVRQVRELLAKMNEGKVADTAVPQTVNKEAVLLEIHEAMSELLVMHSKNQRALGTKAVPSEANKFGVTAGTDYHAETHDISKLLDTVQESIDKSRDDIEEQYQKDVQVIEQHAVDSQNNATLRWDNARAVAKLAIEQAVDMKEKADKQSSTVKTDALKEMDDGVKDLKATLNTAVEQCEGNHLSKKDQIAADLAILRTHSENANVAASGADKVFQNADAVYVTAEAEFQTASKKHPEAIDRINTAFEKCTGDADKAYETTKSMADAKHKDALTYLNDELATVATIRKVLTQLMKKKDSSDTTEFIELGKRVSKMASKVGIKEQPANPDHSEETTRISELLDAVESRIKSQIEKADSDHTSTVAKIENTHSETTKSCTSVRDADTKNEDAALKKATDARDEAKKTREEMQAAFQTANGLANTARDTYVAGQKDASEQAEAGDKQLKMCSAVANNAFSTAINALTGNTDATKLPVDAINERYAAIEATFTAATQSAEQNYNAATDLAAKNRHIAEEDYNTMTKKIADHKAAELAMAKGKFDSAMQLCDEEVEVIVRVRILLVSLNDDKEEALMWFKGDWSACSVGCGGGTRVRDVKCWVKAQGEVVDDSLCKHRGEKPSTTEVCGTGHCTWEAQPWSSCDAGCAGGQKLRDIFCMDGEKRMEASKCDGNSKPVVEETCNTGFCEWFMDEWKTCSKTCGGGVQERVVECIDREQKKKDKDGKDIAGSFHVMADNKCDMKTMPENSQDCNTQGCPGWVEGAWGQCDKKCGTGKKTRPVTCEIDAQEVDAAKCAKAHKPSTEMACNEWACPVPEWEMGDFGNCDKTCGGGEQTREVSCVNTVAGEKKIGAIMEEAKCLEKGDKPATVSKCNEQGCPKWHAGKYGSCSKTCGSGQKERAVECKVDSDVVADKMCDKDSKPVTHGSCNTQDCKCSKKENYMSMCNKDVCTNIVSGFKCTRKKWGVCIGFSTTYTKVCVPVPSPCTKTRTVNYEAQTCE
jgi:hypothetical protein